jgi:two-component system response regulator HydG/two-component system response regulator AtoC
MSAPDQVRRALVVEDDEPIRRLVSTVLSREGFVVVEACDGREAIRYLESAESYVLIVLDLKLPGVGGGQVLQYLRHHLPVSVRRVVIITAGRVTMEGLPEQVCVVLRKPFDLETFINAARTCSA